MATPLKLLVVEDNIADARYIEILLRDVGSQRYDIVHQRTFGQGMAFLDTEKVDVLLLDLSLPDSFGLETIQNANSIAPDMPIIVLTGRSDEDFAVEVVKAGAQDYLVKGEITAQLLSRAIRYAIKRKEMESDLKSFNRKLEKSERDLSGKNTELVRANKALDRFVYLISHELKKPVANIIGLVRILAVQSGGFSPKAKEILQRLDFSSSQIKTMIDTLLEETKKTYAHSGNFEMIELKKIFDEVISELQPMVAEAEAEISLDFFKSPLVFYSYIDLKTIITNLLSNSLKYRSHHRNCKISVKAEMEGSARVLVFCDNGIGIDMVAHGDQIFNRYQRFASGPEGTGLGLWIVKEITDKNGGNIELDTELDKGTMFRVTL